MMNLLVIELMGENNLDLESPGCGQFSCQTHFCVNFVTFLSLFFHGQLFRLQIFFR